MTPLRISVLFIATALALSPQGGAPSRQPSLQVEWLYHGGDPGNSKYSPLTDVNGGNIQRLQIAWQWKHWEAPLPEYGTAPGFFENTPLMIDGVLYVTTPLELTSSVRAEQCSAAFTRNDLAIGRRDALADGRSDRMI